LKGIVTLRLFKVYIILLVEWGFLSLLLFLPNDAWSISPNLMEVLQTQDTSKLPLPIPYSTDSQQSPLFLSRPSNVTEVVEYDPLTKQYIVYEKVGQYNIALPKVMSADEYRQYRIEKPCAITGSKSRLEKPQEREMEYYPVFRYNPKHLIGFLG
jgi:hypothetical protein